MAESAGEAARCQPWISGLYATPTIALAPLFILWFGIGIWSKVLVVVFLVLFPVTINTEAGLRTTSERLIEMLRSFGASPRQIFFKVSLPSAVPFILAGSSSASAAASSASSSPSCSARAPASAG